MTMGKLLLAGVSLSIMSLNSLAAGKQGEVPEIEILRVHTPPVIDGKLDDSAWYGAVYYKSCFAGYFSDAYTDIAFWQPVTYAVYDDDNLYIGFKEYFPYGTTLCGKSSSEKDFYWNDDLAQVYVEPKLDLNALQFAVNADGVVTDKDIKGAAIKGEGFWTAEMAIPWRKLHVGSVKIGDQMGFNIIVYQSFKGSDGWLSWMPLLGAGMTPERFGYIRLGKVRYIPSTPKNISDDNF